LSRVSRKTEIEPIDGTPLKRMFWSIISDYDLKTGLCELVDNALDIWLRNERTGKPLIEVELDANRQLISVADNLGGVEHRDLKFLVAPGGSKNEPTAERIGIFGVGSKRAGVALGEHVEIRTRYQNGRSFELDITKEWLESDDWEIAAYEIPDVAPGTTRIDISHLRRPFAKTDIGDLRAHLAETYSWFLENGCTINLNGTPIASETFENWAYPPDFSPRSAAFDADFGKDGKVSIEITVGLIRDRLPQEDNYGAYIYCNRRLIVKELKTRDVGYATGEAGVPHHDASLCRGVVRIQGPARLMPWNSTKSGINIAHPVFERMRPTLIELMRHFSSLSRRLKDDWEDNVFRYRDGAVENVKPVGSDGKSHLVLPPLPRVRRAAVADLKSSNARQIKEMPWTLGLIEAIAAVDVINRQKLQTKNRIALILLDSNFEIALKEFIVHRTDLFPAKDYGDTRIQVLFSKRHLVVAEVLKRVSIPQHLLDIANHYYSMRNKLIHERATAGLADADIEAYRSAIEEILSILFKLSFPRD
jgi:hypothetical protein